MSDLLLQKKKGLAETELPKQSMVHLNHPTHVSVHSRAVYTGTALDHASLSSCMILLGFDVGRPVFKGVT
jgi:hypothetical protein